MSEDFRAVHLSVRELVEFVLKSGDIDNRRQGRSITNAMLEGANLHRKLQKSKGSDYTAEVPLSITVPVEAEDVSAEITIDGRADGIIESVSETGGREVTVDEIKGVYRDIFEMEGPERVHLAQAEVYAYIYAKEQGLPKIKVQVTYAELEINEKKLPVLMNRTRIFSFEYSFQEIETVFRSYIESYRKWALFIVRHRSERQRSADGFPFPYEFRPGQKKIVREVYKTFQDRQRLFVQAPTGIGKTLSMLYPSVRSVGGGMGDKIFYLTAKTVTGNAAEEAMRLMSERGLRFSFEKITAKEKLCPLDKVSCNPEDCERAKGHFDRINDAVFDCITSETSITTEVILAYAEKYRVCPYEMCLDISYYVDVIICDYNYAFAPHVALQRYFGAGRDQDFIFLIDEAHNLPERAREMYSAVLTKEDVLAAKKLFPNQKTILKWLEKVNKSLLALKRECDRLTVFTEETFPNALVYELMSLYDAISRYLDRQPGASDEMLDFFFEVSDFIDTFGLMDEGYLAYASFSEDNAFFVRLFCINPARRLAETLDRVRSTVFFSATLLPVNYYKELLVGDKEERAMYVDSPFDPANRRLLIASDVSSRYTRRNEEEFRRIAAEIRDMVEGRKGNYLAFFPSYAYLEDVLPYLDTGDFELLIQKRSMREDERDAYLSAFSKPHELSLLGLSVIGGIFSEGIDLKYDDLIGVAVVGTGLPKIGTERGLIEAFYTKAGENGYDYAYRYPGFNKVMQAAGRLIRTVSDRGIILLMDERFTYRQNQALFPKEWADFRVTDRDRLFEDIRDFWQERT